MQLAAAGHAVTAVDSSKGRLARLEENLERTHLAADLVAADALTWNPQRQFDAILLDAPCSATGTFRRHPEVLYRARPPIIEASADMQARLLDRAAPWLKPGAALVYSVCSLEPREGEDIVRAFVGRSQFRDRSSRSGRAPRVRDRIAGGLGPNPSRPARTGRRSRRLLHGTACPRRLIPSNRLHGRTAHCSIDPLRRLRQARRGSARDRRGRRRLDPHRRDGRAFRAQPHDRPRRS